MKTKFKTSSKLALIPPYLFARLDEKKAQAKARGVDVINMGIGDPDKGTLQPIVDAMHEAIDDTSTHDYPPYTGTVDFRKACVKWTSERFGIKEFDPVSECLSTIGSKESIHNIFLAFIDNGDYSLIPDPGYPVYNTGTIFAGGIPHKMPLNAQNSFLPDFDDIPVDIRNKAKIMFLNYPNNPTSAVAPVEFFQEAVDFCSKYGILLAHDMAYSEIYFDNYTSPSIFNAKGAEEIAVEFHSFSKSYNMTGWRLGWVLGNQDAIKAIAQVKTNVDSGVFKAIQKAGIRGLQIPQNDIEKRNDDVYDSRRKAIVEGLRSLGWTIEAPKATMFVWAPIPRSYNSSSDFCEKLLDECGIVVSPGNAFGTYGEGFFRIAMTTDVPRIQEAFSRLKDAGIRF
ncbi:MAG: LL-diaminopimelate aminotransferase [Candidatus Caenarcaniphilales bacterium]|jgi:LL-diaminopimelate aminotransferase|nr:LL-diaminopimelate aminotransferase [Candidatus Caenarcaniphilales bacterium]